MNLDFLPASVLCDFYKVSHREQYPKNTTGVYSTWTPRTSRMEGVTSVVAYGFQIFVKEYLIDFFNKNFFSRPKEEVVEEYRRVIKYCLFVDDPDTSHIEALHDLGYLPLLIKTVDEGTIVPIRCPMATIENTDDRFSWLTNYIETLWSDELWKPTTSATTAYEYRKLLNKYAMETVGSIDGVEFQGHDFSMRGMSNLADAAVSGSAHLLSFCGTDTIPAILLHERFYGADMEKELVGTSIPATEHSVMCSYGKGNEFEAYKRIITEIYPAGFVSIVSDTWDLWKVLTDIIKPLKNEIMERDGRVVIRPDSGDPVKIICGDPEAKDELVRKGVVEILWDIFGGTTTEKGYKLLDSHIGAIYGDSITLERAMLISEGLKAKGFASTNCVYGIGSFTYQYVTRDTFGFAIKSTWVKVDGEERKIFKDPITDSGVKRSARGRVVVSEDDGEIYYFDGLSEDDELTYMDENLMTPIFQDGNLMKETTLRDIRKRLLEN